MFDKLKTWVVEQVLWAEKNMAGKTGAEKRQAVVDKLDALITLPWWLEWMDGPLIGWLVDKVCGVFNAEQGHDWVDKVQDTKETVEVVVKELPDVDAYTRGATEVMTKAVEEAAAAAPKAAEAVVEKAQAAASAVTSAGKTAAAAKSSDKMSAHFSKKEFACKCCGKFIPCPELVEKLEKFRTLCGNKPMTISNGTRCEKHNKEVGGAQKKYDKNGKLISQGSQHLYGKAADVQKIPGLTVDQMAKLAEQAGFNGIGKYNWGVHVDVRSTPARWDYRK